MCNPASFVLTKDRVYWSLASDSHSVIIDEYKLHAEGVRGANVVAVEITPPDDDMSRPLAEWVFEVDDQYPVPNWWDAEDGERRARTALVDWAAALLVTSGIRKLSAGRLFASGSATVEASGSATVEAWDSATVEAWDSATVIRWSDNASVTLDGLAIEVDRSTYGSVSLRGA